MVEELNKTDIEIISYCLNFPRRINEIAKHIGITPKNIVVRVRKLKNLGEVDIYSKGYNKTYVRSIKGNKREIYIKEILKKIKSKREVTTEDYANLLPFESFETDFDKLNATTMLPFVEPKLIQKYVRLTPEGEKFLKENQNEKK